MPIYQHSDRDKEYPQKNVSKRDKICLYSIAESCFCYHHTTNKCTQGISKSKQVCQIGCTYNHKKYSY